MRLVLINDSNIEDYVPDLPDEYWRYEIRFALVVRSINSMKTVVPFPVLLN